MDCQTSQNRVHYILWMFMPVIICFAVQYALSIMEIQAVVAYEVANYYGEGYTAFILNIYNDIASDAGMGVIYILYPVICIPIFIYIYFKEYRQKDKPFIKGVSGNIPCTIAGIIVFTIGAQYTCMYIMNSVATAFPSWLEEYEQIMEAAGISDSMTVTMTVYSIILGPIVEELTFRVLTYKAASKLMPAHMAIIVQALLFGAYHMNMLQAIYAFALGLGLGYVMYKYDNVIITIIIHVAFNLLGTIGNNYLVYGGDTLITYFLWMLGSLIVTYAGIKLLKKGMPGVKSGINNADI